ncbi:hypothetical protein NLJ89_g11012 [Agrocybe chaxingu]|uniref:Dihydrolipoamide acetyltransferase component of pyruvate dehydrogenase complex n=1 Tax=Agrocybe chaxingu TaxID=84603 RepID=A0A9W8JPI6_9AGAR|nr:hypothetical protein NLJ89_g11012 [Agrocybe chaxingu]
MISRPLRRLLGRPLAVSYFHTSPSHWASRKVLQKFKLADIGEGITECEIVKWSIKPQSTVQAFDPLCEVQSDKASVEITSPYDGVVKELLVQEGEVAKVGSGLCLIEVDEEVPDGAQDLSHEPFEQPSKTAEEKAPSYSSTSTTTAARRLHPLDPNNLTVGKILGADKVFCVPSVRHFARQQGVDLGLLVPGSGKDGRIEKRDVEAYLAGGRDSAPQEAPAAPQRDDVVVELNRTRYGMWKAMTKSLEIPHFGYSTTLDITALHDLLPILNSHIPSHYLPESSRPPSLEAVNPSAIYQAPAPGPVPDTQQYKRLTYLPILLKTLSKAMIEWPLFRSSITPRTDPSAKPTLTVRPNADISIALSTPTGLYTPTLQGVNSEHPAR